MHTRGQGARPEGFSEFQPAKRERRMRYLATPAPAPYDGTDSPPDSPFTIASDEAYVRHMSAQMEKPQEHHEDVPKLICTCCPIHNTQMETNKKAHQDALTRAVPKLIHAVPGSAKRRREVEEDGEPSISKRRKAATTPETFLFSKNRNRSLLTSAPPKLGRHRETDYYGQAAPASPEPRRVGRVRRTGSQERLRPQPQSQPQTPTPTPTQGGIFGSMRKMFSWGRRANPQAEAANERQQQRSPLSEENHDSIAVDEEDYSDEGSLTASPTQARNTYELDSPTPEPENAHNNLFTRENWDKRRAANTRGGRAKVAAMNESNFNPAPTPGSNKRKLFSVDGHIPGPKKGGFGIDDSYLDVDNDVEGIGESSLANTEPSTPRNNRPLSQTPLRSALRQTGNNFGTIGRSGKTVRINSVPTSAKAVYGQYGPAGEYRGSTFADISSQATDSPSDVLPWDVNNMMSPNTMRNTQENTPYHFDPNVKDPHDADWRPSPANPRPGTFMLPDYDDEDTEEDDTGAATLDQSQGAVPAQPPSTPRMSHAELPQTSPTPFDESGFTGHTDSIMVNDTQEIRLNKARSDAQKYKPAKSSRLSLSEQARSRSSSPPGEYSEFRESQLEVSTPETFRPRNATTAEETTMLTASPIGREDLDSTVVGDDGMTDYQREHQFDAWAEDIFNKITPQTYVEAGVASSYVDNLVEKTWTARDARESVEFWDREFEEGLRAAREAREEGRELVWVTDPDEIVELEQGGS